MRSMQITRVYKAVAVGAVLIAATLSGQVQAQSKVLTDKAGMTVYTFDKDSPGRSACYSACAAAWPPVLASNITSGPEFSAVTRADGIDQAAYKGKPLYLFAGDKKPGDMTGDKVQNVWHVVTPAGKQQSSRASQAGYTSSGY